MLNVAMIIASVLYIFCFVLAKRKLASIHRVSPNLGLKKLLVLSVLLICVVRIMSFVGVTAMDIANVRAHYSPRPSATETAAEQQQQQGEPHYHHRPIAPNRNQRFYDASMTVLFDLPNAIVVSTYVLLTLVWAECFLQSRLHTESVIEWKTRWLTGYTVFNFCLYSVQIILYILVVFWPISSSVVKSILYAAMTGINFTAVVMVCALYYYLNLKFAGFPFRSRHTKESLTKISSVFALWSTSRIVWAIAMLLVFIYGIELLQDTFWTPIVLFLLLFLCEIVPILAMLDYSFIQIIDFEIGSNRNLNSSNHLEAAVEESRGGRLRVDSGSSGGDDGDESFFSDRDSWSSEGSADPDRLRRVLLEDDDEDGDL